MPAPVALSARESFGQMLRHKLARGLQHAGLTAVGDSYSTGMSPSRWPYRLAQRLAYEHRGYTVIYAEFNAGYAAAVGIQAGTGQVALTGAGAAITTTGGLSMTANSAVTSGGLVQLRSDGKIEPHTSGTPIGTAVSSVAANATTQVNFGAGNGSTVTATAPVLVVYSAALSGTGWDYVAGRAHQMVGPYQPDLIIVMDGTNEQTLVGAEFMQRMTMALEALRFQSPDSELALADQPDQGASSVSAPGSYNSQRRSLFQEYAQRNGHVLADINELFRSPRATGKMQVDDVHPTYDAPGDPLNGVDGTDGHALILSEIMAGMALRRGTFRGARQRPPNLMQRAARPLFSTDFTNAAWDGTAASFATVFGGTLTNVATAKDTVNAASVESPVSQGVALSVASSGAGTAQWVKDLVASGFTDLTGRWITLCALVYVPASQNAAVARMRLASDGTVNYTQTQWLSSTQAFGASRILPIIVHHQVRTTPDRIRLTFFVDSSGTGNSTPAPAMTLLTLCLVRGKNPRIL